MDSPADPNDPHHPQPPGGSAPGLPATAPPAPPAPLGADCQFESTYLAWLSLKREMEAIHARLEYIRLMLKLESRSR